MVVVMMMMMMGDNSTSNLIGSWCGAEDLVQESETPESERRHL
jgi:hypothetical protein